MNHADPRRLIPRTDELLALAPVREATAWLGVDLVRSLIHQTQDRSRRGQLAPDLVRDVVLQELGSRRPTALRPVLNATGIIVHTNLGRAPLSIAAREALQLAGGYVDVELDLATGHRARRGDAARGALLRACAAAGDALIVNNGAAALLLATTALAAGRDVILSRGEHIEIGAGFRLPDLIASTGARVREVGTTNRTHLRDYTDAVGADTGCVLKVHPSNYRIEGFTSEVSLRDLRSAIPAAIPLVADLGSGLLVPDPALPGEPDVRSALTAGADLVLASGDKLLGGPQAGILLGDAVLIGRLAKHPLARALRVDKLTLAALEATLSAATNPVHQYLHADPGRLQSRTERLAAQLHAPVVPHEGRVGGGGAAGIGLPGWAVQLPVTFAEPLRLGDPAVLPRVHRGGCLIDLRCVPEDDDNRLLSAIRQASVVAHPARDR